MRADRRNTRGWNYATRGITAGSIRTVGGMLKATAGTRTVIGTIGITSTIETTIVIMTAIVSNS